MSKYFETRAGSLEEAINAMKYEEPGKYAKIFKRELEKAGKGIGAMSPQEKKDFFNKLDKMYHAKNEDLNSKDEPSVKDVANQLKKAVKAHGQQAKDLEKAIKSEAQNEGRMSDIDAMRKKGASAAEIAKELKLDPKVVKQILGEGTMIGGLMRYSGQPSSEYMKAKKAYKDFMSKAQPAKTAGDRVMGFVFDDELLDDIYDASKKNKADVRDMVAKRLKQLGFREEAELDETHSYMTSKMNKKQKDAGGEKEPVKPMKESFADALMRVWNTAAEELDEVKKNAKYMKSNVDTATDEPADGDDDVKEKTKKEDNKAELEKAKQEIAMLKTKLENEKNKAVKPEPNPETGEVPLTVGVAYKHLKDKMAKEEKEEEEESYKDKAKENKAKTLTGSKMTKIDTKPEVEYK